MNLSFYFVFFFVGKNIAQVYRKEDERTVAKVTVPIFTIADGAPAGMMRDPLPSGDGKNDKMSNKKFKKS